MQRKTPAKRLFTVLILFVLLSASVVISVIAYYVRSTGDVTNTFSPAVAVDPTIEDGNSNVKINVGVTDYPVYVRAAIVITWLDEDGNTIFGYDGTYDLKLNLTQNGWVEQSDGYYYFRKPVESGGQTDVLINTCTPTGNPDAYTLNVDVIAQTVQAVGNTDANGEIPAYQDAWGLSLNLDEP